MGYELHITRKAHWADENGPEISLDEWLGYVSADPEMRLDGFAEAPLPGGGVLRAEDQSLAVWTAWPGDGGRDGGGDGGMDGLAWMWLSGDGAICAKHPDIDIRRKMWRIAQDFGARLVGDDGEQYGADGEIDTGAMDDARLKPQPWWKFW
ncbi:MAG: hypothetical protein KTR21_09315 [Rhodobacteraceae bacterium]|nr:hypothetical protein [Paracoccaceae bacterium]